MRVYPGGITLTRAIGGLPLKRRPRAVLTADAEVVTSALDGTEVALVLACDGVWDVLDAEGAAAVLAEAPPNKDPAEVLARAAYDRGSTDNITAVVLQWPRANGENKK